ncbi:MAG: ComF family protein, partial [Anaerolineae bacterium]
FEGPLRDALHAFKYRGGRHVADVLAPKMAFVWKRQKMSADLLVPVPLYPSREAKRGYNQAAILASALSREIEIPTANRVLKRVRNTPSQTGFDREGRRQNVAGAFVCADGLDLAGRTVTLVDDVATTGATLDACADALMAAGAKAISAFTLARAP